jgi:hypothetical protein
VTMLGIIDHEEKNLAPGTFSLVRLSELHMGGRSGYCSHDRIAKEKSTQAQPQFRLRTESLAPRLSYQSAVRTVTVKVASSVRFFYL